MTPCPGHNGRVSHTGSLAPRLVVIALLALGLVGMHHLVVAACHHGASHTAHSPMVVSNSTASHSTAGHSTADAFLGTVVEVPKDAPAPSGLVGVAATCLAILLMIIGLVVPRLVSRLRRVTMIDRGPRAVGIVSRLLEPPDLTLLSVSRT